MGDKHTQKILSYLLTISATPLGVRPSSVDERRQKLDRFLGACYPAAPLSLADWPITTIQYHRILDRLASGNSFTMRIPADKISTVNTWFMSAANHGILTLACEPVPEYEPIEINLKDDLEWWEIMYGKDGKDDCSYHTMKHLLGISESTFDD